MENLKKIDDKGLNPHGKVLIDGELRDVRMVEDHDNLEYREEVNYGGDDWADLVFYDRTLVDIIFSATHQGDSKWGDDSYSTRGRCQILFNKKSVYEFRYGHEQVSGLAYAMSKAQITVAELKDHPAFNWQSGVAFHDIVGRKVWYDRTKAVVEALYSDGRLILKPEDSDTGFSPPAHHNPDEDPEWEYHETMITDILSPAIWWWRK